MRVAVIGSRGLRVENLEDYLPKDTTEIVSGGARGVDTSAREYALKHGLKLTEYLPEYGKYRRSTPTEGRSRRGAALALFPRCPPRQRPVLPPQPPRRSDTPLPTMERPAGPCAEKPAPNQGAQAHRKMARSKKVLDKSRGSQGPLGP